MNHLVGFESLAPGLIVKAVGYDQLPFEAERNGDGVDAVSMAVVIDFGEVGVARFHWRLDQTTEDLWVGPWRPGDPPTEIRRQDATDRWGLANASLVGYSLALQKTDRRGSLTPWSCRLVFDRDRSLVIALGELSPAGGLTYIPDNLIVTNSMKLASAYRPTAATSNAWGDTT